MEWVLDCSLALCWGLPDEPSDDAEQFLESLPPKTRLWVPALFWYEVANALTAAQRRGRISPAQAAQLLAMYGGFPVSTDSPGGGTSLARLHGLASAHGLTAYDAAYLELALRKGAGLATGDRDLAAAADGADVVLALPRTS